MRAVPDCAPSALFSLSGAAFLTRASSFEILSKGLQSAFLRQSGFSSAKSEAAAPTCGKNAIVACESFSLAGILATPQPFLLLRRQ